MQGTHRAYALAIGGNGGQMRLRTPSDRQDGQQDLLDLIRTLTSNVPARGNYGQWTRIPYQPRPLCTRKIILSDETQGAISKLETTATRYDCLIGESDFSDALRRVMHRLEGVYSWQLNGMAADYRLCCYIDHFSKAGTAAEQANPQRALTRLLGVDDEAVRAATGALQIAAIMDGVFAGDLEANNLTPARIVAIHDAIASALHPSQACGLRTWDLPPIATPGNGSAYVAPAPATLHAYLDDIAMFVATSKLGPVTKAALTHFQLETVRMFSSNLDEASRVITACLWKNSGLITHMMPPISITPAIQTSTHTRKLHFYLFEPSSCELLMLDDWVYLIACSTLNAFEIEWLCFQKAKALVESWKQRLGEQGVKISTQFERLLVELIGSPVFSISAMEQTVGSSFSTTGAMVETLVQAGIALQVNEGRRNRVFECPEALALFTLADRAFRKAEE